MRSVLWMSLMIVCVIAAGFSDHPVGFLAGLTLAAVCGLELPPSAMLSPAIRAAVACAIFVAAVVAGLFTGFPNEVVWILTSAALVLTLTLICWSLDVVERALAPICPESSTP